MAIETSKKRKSILTVKVTTTIDDHESVHYYVDREAAEEWIKGYENNGWSVKVEDIKPIKTGYVHIDDIEVGDQLTYTIYTDAECYTVIKKTAKTVTAQKDYQEIDHDKWKPETIPGGFAGHTVNNWSQIWKISPNPNGSKVVLRAGKDGYLKYPRTKRRNISHGANPHYDYNF